MKAVIFDMDGVIFDSEKCVCDGWVELSEKYGFANPMETLKKCFGINLNATRDIFYHEYGSDFPFDKYHEEESKNFHEKYYGGRLPMKEGVKELLSFLKENGYLTAIASSTRIATVTSEIKDAGLYDYFDKIIGGDMVKNSKPDPEIFIKAAGELGVNPDEAYVIEDSYNGIRAAYAGGFTSIMVPDMLGPDEEIRSKADYIFDSLLEVKKFLSDR